VHKVKITRTTAIGDNEAIQIEAPEGKEMVFDASLLQHGVLSIGEYGPSGIKVAAFKDWNYAVFLSGDEGYTITNGE
jgi:hypothetical protein